MWYRCSRVPRDRVRGFYRIGRGPDTSADPCAHNRGMSTLAPPDSERATSLVPPPPPTPDRALSESPPVATRVRATNLRRDLVGGIASAGRNLALGLSLGILAFSPLGPDHYHIGLYAGFASAIWGHLVAGLFGGAAHPGSGPHAAPTLILASLVAVLAADPALRPLRDARRRPDRRHRRRDRAHRGHRRRSCSARFGAANSARFVPYPFVAGFMCGASALIILAQLTPLVRSDARRPRGRRGSPTRARAAARTLVVGIATAATIWAIGGARSASRRRSSDSSPEASSITRSHSSFPARAPGTRRRPDPDGAARSRRRSRRSPMCRGRRSRGICPSS